MTAADFKKKLYHKTVRISISELIELVLVIVRALMHVYTCLTEESVLVIVAGIHGLLTQ